MAEIKAIIIDTNKRKDGTFAVYVVTVVKGAPVRFNTGVLTTKENWDSVKQLIKGNTKDIKDDNLAINNSKARVNDVFVRYRLQHKELTPALLRKEYAAPSLYIDFYKFFEEQINKRDTKIVKNTQDAHLSVLHKMQNYRKSLTFSEIDEDWINDFTRHLIKGSITQPKNNLNTIYSTLKTIKTYLNIAVKNKIITDSPFKTIKLSEPDSEIIYLEENELAVLTTKYKSDELTAQFRKTLRRYLFSCFTGLRISDIRSITFDNIVGNVLVFVPIKTSRKNKQVRIPLGNAALELIFDECGTRKNGKIFDMQADAYTNRILKNIAKKLEINKPIKYHSSRHTFATMFLRKGGKVQVLQQLLGHSKITQTMKYVHVLTEDIEQEMKLMDSLW